MARPSRCPVPQQSQAGASDDRAQLEERAHRDLCAVLLGEAAQSQVADELHENQDPRVRSQLGHEDELEQDETWSLRFELVVERPPSQLDEGRESRRCPSPRTTRVHRVHRQFSVVLVAAASGDYLDRVQHRPLTARSGRSRLDSRTTTPLPVVVRDRT